MGSLVAALSFPVRPCAAARRLAGSRGALLAPLVPGAVTALWFALRGCAAGDALAGGGGLALVVLGLGLGGLLGCYPATLLLGRTFRLRALAAPCLVFASWTPPLFVGVLLLARALGAGAAAALAAGLGLLVWGIVAGIGVLTGDDEEVDHGRALVASCTALAVALAGLWAGLATVPAALVTAVPAPVAADGFAAGDRLLVRVGAAGAPGDLVLLLGRDREAVLARVGADGRPSPVGTTGTERAGDLRVIGRVFFRIGAGGGSAVEPSRRDAEKSPG